jgi:hypothetical protein
VQEGGVGSGDDDDLDSDDEADTPAADPHTGAPTPAPRIDGIDESTLQASPSLSSHVPIYPIHTRYARYPGAYKIYTGNCVTSISM